MTSILKVDEIQNTDGKTGLVITPDGSVSAVSGVKFPEITGGDPARVITSTTMSSYEEGTWVPQFGYGSPISTSGITYAGFDGRYTRIGNMVYVDGIILISGWTDTSDGSVVITGLPFAVDNYTGLSSILSGSGVCSYSNGFDNVVDVITVVTTKNSDKSLSLYAKFSDRLTENHDSNVLSKDIISNNMGIRFSSAYRTDE